MTQLLIGTILIGLGYGCMGIIVSRIDGPRNGVLFVLLAAIATLALAGMVNIR